MMINHFIAASLSLLLGLNYLVVPVHGQTSQVSQTQPVVRLKSTLDVSGVSLFHSEPVNLNLLLTSSSPFLHPISKLVLLQRKTSLQLLDISNGEVQRIFPEVRGLPILSPSAQRLMIIDRKSASVWSVKTGEKLCDLGSLPKEPNKANWSRDEKSIMLFKQEDGFKAALLDKEKTVARVYDAETGRLRFKIKIKSLCAHAEFSPNSRWILTTSDKEDAKLWDALTGQQKATLSRDQMPFFRGASATFSPDGRFIFVSSRSFGMSLWETSSGNLHLQLTEGKFGMPEYRFRGFSPDGKLLVFYREHMKGWAKIYSSLELRDTETGEIKSVLKDRNMRDNVDQLEWSADGKTLVTADGDKEYNGRIWDVKTGRLIFTFPMIRKYSRIPLDFGYKDQDSLSFHPTLPIVMIVNNHFVRLLNADTGKLLQKLGNATHPVRWTADGRLLITNTKDGKTVQIWELVQSNLLAH